MGPVSRAATSGAWCGWSVCCCVLVGGGDAGAAAAAGGDGARRFALSVRACWKSVEAYSLRQRAS
eukprot:35330-Rhodomonas_salina.1